MRKYSEYGGDAHNGARLGESLQVVAGHLAAQDVNTVVASEHIGHPRWQVVGSNLIRDFPREHAFVRS